MTDYLRSIRTDDNDRLQYIDTDTLDYLIDVAKPRSIEYERATIRKLFAIRHKKPWHCGSAKNDIGCHIRMCRSLQRERHELISERGRRRIASEAIASPEQTAFRREFARWMSEVTP